MPADRPRVRTAVIAAVAALATAAAILFALGAWSKLPEASPRFSAEWAAIAVAGFLAVQLCDALLWRLMLGLLGGEIGVAPGLSAWCLSSLGRYVPTSIPMPVLRVMVAQENGVPARICLASMAYEGALSLLAALVVCCALLTKLPAGVPRLAALAAIAVLAIAIQPRVFGRLANAVLHRLGRDKLEAVLDARTIPPLALAYVALFALAGASVFATVRAIDPTGISTLPVAIGAFGAGFVASVLIIVVPGGLGVREAGIAAALSIAVPFEVALAAAVIVRVIQVTLELALTALTTAWARSKVTPR